jgi:pimeloyl-ACP methyl ester carboxylesterase
MKSMFRGRHAMLKTPELQYVSYKGGRLAYRETGAGPALFLLHGMNGSSQTWRHLFAALASSFRIVAWDAPSFGASDEFGDRVDDFVCAANALMKALSLNDPIVIGHSMGGVVAAQLAADKETSVAGLVLSSTHLGFALPKGEALLDRYATRIDRIREEGVDMAYGLDRARRSTPEGTSDEVIGFLAEVATSARIEGIRDGGRMSQEADNATISPNVRAPVLILSGGSDTVISPDMHAALVSAFPKAKQVVFPKTGHASYAECPDLFNEQIRQFANQCKSHGLSTSKKLIGYQ